MKNTLVILTLLSIAFSSCKKEPVASFDMDQNNVKAPVQINFKNTSSEATEFLWDFGDNSNSQASDPSHMYETWGNMNVSLTASGEGGSSTITKTLIIIPPEPVADFGINIDRAMVGESVSFTNFAKYATSYNWNFGDGKTSEEENPTHIYDVNGTFTVTLSITGEGGSNQVSKQIEIYYPEPVAIFDIDQTIIEKDQSISFTNLSSYATDYEWDFGDGTSSTETNPKHTYTKGGAFTVKLTANSLGGTSVYGTTIYVTSENVFVDDFKNKDSWIFEHCDASINDEQLLLNPTSTTTIGRAEHLFSPAIKTPWTLSAELALNESTSDVNIYGIFFPLSSTKISAMRISIINNSTEINWGLHFFVPSLSKWYTWDETTIGISNSVKTSLNSINKIEIQVDNNEKITFKCNGTVILEKHNAINSFESMLSTNISLDIDELWLNSGTAKTLWDNLFFEGAPNSTAIAIPTGKNNNSTSIIENNNIKSEMIINDNKFLKEIMKK